MDLCEAVRVFIYHLAFPLYNDYVTKIFKVFSLMYLGECGSGWMMNRLKEGNKYYFNVHSMEFAWERHENMRKDYSLLTRDEIQVKFLVILGIHLHKVCTIYMLIFQVFIM